MRATVYRGSSPHGRSSLAPRRVLDFSRVCHEATRDMEIKPFSGYRYAGATKPDVSAIVAPPYDQISPETQDRLHALSPHNIVRVTYPRDGDEKYRKAASVLEAWVAEGVWRRDERPAFYPYQQTYSVGGQSLTRTGFIALGEVSDYARGVVLPHERTHAGPKEDRMRLLEATAADIGLLFMLASDPDGELRRAAAPVGEPIAEAEDLRGEHHRLWRITDDAALARIATLMAPRPVIIADGHHRYETAVAYRQRHPRAAEKMMAFFPLEAPGLTILPNHRLVHNVQPFDFDDFVQMASRWFAVAPLEDPLTFRPTTASIGVVSGPDAAVLTLRAESRDLIAWPAGTSAAWRALAVSILHEGLLHPLLGITDARLDAKTHVEYTADLAEAVRLARAGTYQAAFLIAPPTPAELQAVVRGGELLPQKSTHFYPKLVDGLVFHRLDT
ncbi:MAG: hypothetical protein DME04_21410 [Candidatus Rokuibacteriota bacterium]|nr:MAG: hypothetical protein DME04_21410 [Candidatus Rokubacteria bacterium]